MSRSLVVAALLALSAGEALPASPGGMAVLRASVRFGHGDRASLRVEGDFTVVGNLAALDPAAADLRLSLGPAAILDGLPAGSKVRVRANGDWKVKIRRPYGDRGSLSLTLHPGSGTFVLDARGWDGSALLAGGPVAVPCIASAGESTGEDPLDFEARGRRWEYRRATPPRPGPGGGGGGGPPPASGVTTIAQGSMTGIRNYRFEVVKDDAAWQALWFAHAGSGPAPSVDFSTEMVVGIWLGPRPTGGYVATIASFTPGTVLGVPCSDTDCPPQGMFVGVIESQPGGACAVPQAVSYPFHIVKVPRADWGGVMVEIATRVDDCF